MSPNPSQSTRPSFTASVTSVEEVERRARLREMLHRGLCNGKYRWDRMVCSACLEPMRQDPSASSNQDRASPLFQFSAKLAAHRQIIISAITSNSQTFNGVDAEGRPIVPLNTHLSSNTPHPEDGANDPLFSAAAPEAPAFANNPYDLDDGIVALEPIDAPSGFVPQSARSHNRKALGYLSEPLSPTKLLVSRLHNDLADSSAPSSSSLRVVIPRALHMSEELKQKMCQQLNESEAIVSLERLEHVSRGCRFYPSDSWSSTAHFYQVEEPLERFFRTLASRSLYTQTAIGQLVQTMAPCRTLARYHRSYIPIAAEQPQTQAEVLFLEDVSSEDETRSLSDQLLDPSDLRTAAATRMASALPLAEEDSESSLTLSCTPVLSAKRIAQDREPNGLCASESKALPTEARALRKRRHESSAAASSSVQAAIPTGNFYPLRANKVGRLERTDSSDIDMESVSDVAGDRVPLSNRPATPFKIRLPVQSAPAEELPISPGEFSVCFMCSSLPLCIACSSQIT